VNVDRWGWLVGELVFGLTLLGLHYLFGQPWHLLVLFGWVWAVGWATGIILMRLR
jgi:hypothetical protein